MKLREVYVPVFTEIKSKDEKIRRLRSDFGSRRTSLECANCGNLFEKRTGPNTNEVSCPKCGHNRVRLSKPEKAKTKVMEMREHLEVAELHEAADCSMWVLANLIGDNRHSTLPTIQEALAGLAAVEPALGDQVRSIFSLAKDGKGRKEITDIAIQMDLFHHFAEQVDFGSPEEIENFKTVFKTAGGKVVAGTQKRGDSVVIEFPLAKEANAKNIKRGLERGMKGRPKSQTLDIVLRREEKEKKVFLTFRKHK